MRASSNPLLDIAFVAQGTRSGCMGVLLMAFADASFAYSAVAAKSVVDMSPWKYLLLRSLMFSVVSLPVLGLHWASYKASLLEHILHLSVVGCVMQLSQYGFVFGVRRLSVGNAVILFTMTPVYAVLIQSLMGTFSGFTSLMAATVIMVTSGCFLVAQPEFLFRHDDDSSVDPLGVIIAMSGGILYALYIVMVAQYYSTKPSDIHADLGLLHYMFVHGVMGLVLCSVAMVCADTEPFVWNHTDHDWAYAALYATSNALGTITFTWGCSMQSGLVSAIMATWEGVFALLAGFIFLQETPNMWQLVGSVLIIASSILAEIDKHVNTSHAYAEVAALRAKDDTEDQRTCSSTVSPS
eukprot:TRINITY_DN10206_c0_g1_i1.p1 TRINITY_DN10206_c0_g1~~TRINITY_DN10206_c0_g1_i1.p1  ORF type:complete len:353 (+),score=16.61 TRINITY_DN10206_c0_g1_i1:42-1100(+)